MTPAIPPAVATNAVKVAKDAEAVLTDAQVRAIVQDEWAKATAKERCYALMGASVGSLLLDGLLLAGHQWDLLLGLLSLETPILPLIGKYCKF